MVDVIIKVTKDFERVSFVRVEENNLILVDDIREATKFSKDSNICSTYLKKVRKSFKQYKFKAVSVPTVIFSKPLRNLINA